MVIYSKLWDIENKIMEKKTFFPRNFLSLFIIEFLNSQMFDFLFNLVSNVENEYTILSLDFVSFDSSYLLRFQLHAFELNLKVNIHFQFSILMFVNLFKIVIIRSYLLISLSILN